MEGYTTLSDLCATFEHADRRTLIEVLDALYGGRATTLDAVVGYRDLECAGFWSTRQEYLTQQQPMRIKGESSPEGESVTTKAWTQRRKELPAGVRRK